MTGLKRYRVGHGLDMHSILPIGSLTEAGGLLFTYGVIAVNSDVGKVDRQDLEGQVTQVIQNIKDLLASRERSLDDIVMIHIFLNDISRDFDRFNQIYTEWFPEDPPTRYCIGATLAPFGDARLLVEMHAIASVE